MLNSSMEGTAQHYISSSIALRRTWCSTQAYPDHGMSTAHDRSRTAKPARRRRSGSRTTMEAKRCVGRKNRQKAGKARKAGGTRGRGVDGGAVRRLLQHR